MKIIDPIIRITRNPTMDRNNIFEYSNLVIDPLYKLESNENISMEMLNKLGIELVDEYEIFRYVNCNNVITKKYIISNYGRVYTLIYNKFLAQRVRRKYLHVHLTIDKINREYATHRLVCMTFKPIDNPWDYVCNHEDADKLNNYAINLDWMTDKQNAAHAVKTGCYRIGENHPFALITEKQAHDICQCLEKKMSYKEIYDFMSIDVEYEKFTNILYNILHKISWKMISDQYNIDQPKRKTNNYSKDTIHHICKYIEEGKTNREIADLLNITEKQERRSLLEVIYRIRHFEAHVEISSKYNISTSDKRPIKLVTEEEVHFICKKILEGLKNFEIADLLVGENNTDIKRNNKKLKDCITNIRNKVTYKSISDKYF